jgi:hypothetical protein
VISPDLVVTGEAKEFYLEAMDLATPLRGRERFPGTGTEFDPAVSPSHVAWKVVEPGFAPHNWGAVRVLDRATGREIALDVDRARSPSIGARYVTVEEITGRRLVVYDLVEDRLVDLSDQLPEGATAVANQSVAGNLLTFQLAFGDEAPRLAWAWLPPPG